MSGVEGFNDKVAFIWPVVDLLRGDVGLREYGPARLPFVILRRLDYVLEPTKAGVIWKAKPFEARTISVPAPEQGVA